MKQTVALLILLLAAPLVLASTSGPSGIPTPPNFIVNSNAAYLCKGQVNYIPITVTNLGTPGALNSGGASAYGPSMINVQLNVGNSKNIYPAKNNTATIATINPGNSSVGYVPAFVNANSSTYIQAQIDINYYFDTLYTDSEARNLSFVTETCTSGLNISVSPKILEAGIIQNVTVDMVDTGNMPFNSLLLRLSLPGTQGTMLTPQPVQVASITPHNAISLTESLFVSKNASQSVPLNVTATYYNGTNLNQLFESLPTLASGIINMTASSFTVSPSLPTPSSIFSISFVLTDIGTSGASALTVTPITPKGFSEYGSPSVFVGDISADSQTPVTLSLIASNTLKPGRYTIPIRVNYLNNLRSNVTVWANTSVDIGASALNASAYASFRRTQSGGSGLGILTLILVIAVAVLGYLYLKERRRHK